MTTTIHKAGDIASVAAGLVGGDRESTHGDKVINHEKIAAVWNGVLIAADKRPAQPLDAHDIANLMEALKIARRYHGAFNIDDYIDGAGYAAVAGEVKSRQIEQERINKTWSDAAIEGFPAGPIPHDTRASDQEAVRLRDALAKGESITSADLVHLGLLVTADQVIDEEVEKGTARRALVNGKPGVKTTAPRKATRRVKRTSRKRSRK